MWDSVCLWDSLLDAPVWDSLLDAPVAPWDVCVCAWALIGVWDDGVCVCVCLKTILVLKTLSWCITHYVYPRGRCVRIWDSVCMFEPLMWSFFRHFMDIVDSIGCSE